jgi:CheY-like chemotaxis protein
MTEAFNSSAPSDHPHENIPDALARAAAGGEQDAAAASDLASATASEVEGAVKARPGQPERRSRRRVLISAPVRVRTVDVTQGGPDEVSTTLDVSRSGFLFVSSLASFSLGMEVAVTIPYSKSPMAIQAEQPGRVTRISEMPDGRRAVAIALRETTEPELVDAGGHQLGQKASPKAEAAAKRSDKPVVLIVDADAAVRDSLKLFLTDEGYEVIAVGNAAEAHVVLSLFTPALVIAEIEGDDLPGYDLCARIKTTPRLQAIPVMLLTRSAYPSDYANGHSLGATVCMAKPFRMERFGHVVRLLAPTIQARQQPAPPRPVDPKRKNGAGKAAKARASAKHPARNGTRPRR